MRRLPVKQMFCTWMKTLLHCGYKYLLNLLVTLVTGVAESEVKYPTPGSDFPKFPTPDSDSLT